MIKERRVISTKPIPTCLLLEQCDSGGAEDEASFAQSFSLSRHDYGFHQAGFVKNPIVQTTIRSDLEVMLFRYFSDYFLPVLMLRNAHPGFYAEYRTCLGRLILNCDSVKCAILACCASNRYMLDRDPSLRQVSLRYYTQAVRHVNRALATSDWACERPSDHLLNGGECALPCVPAVHETPLRRRLSNRRSFSRLD